jgi:uncharacterized protein (TIGR03437 family)
LQAFDAAGGAGSVAVTTQGGCAWTAVSNAAFVSITSGASGSGNGTVNFSVAANSDSAPRSGTLTIGGQTFTVNQGGTGCTFSISPTSQDFAAAGGTGSVTVTAPGGCPWTAASNAAFLVLTSSANGAGSGTVTFNVAANSDSASRSGTLTIAGQTFTVNQAGTGCMFAINPASQNFTAAGGNGSITVTVPGGCAWTAVSNAAFVNVTSGGSGSGNGTVNFSVAANTGAARAGTLTVAGLTFNVTQDGTAPPPNAPSVSEGGVVNNGSFALHPAPLAPGSIAAVFGVNLNDGSEISSSSFGTDGKLITTLGGASVRINNIPAPLFYSFPGQLGVQIPIELAGQSSATIVVTVGGQSSAPRIMNLAAAAPGIFTVNQQGTEIAAVLHQNGITPVSESSPAQPGEIVTFFLTGLGAVSPALTTGEPSTLNTTVLTPTATVDGAAADVVFSGAAPNFVGLYQINLRVPSGTRTANNIPVRVTIGGVNSNQVTIPVAP